MASWVVGIYAWSTISNFFDLTRPQRPPTEKVPKFNMSFHDSVKKLLFSKHQSKVIIILKLLNSRTWKTLKSSVVIFQALENSPASLTSAASATSLASTASKAQFPKKLLDPDGLIITGTKITNTGHFLWNWSPKIQFFTNIWQSFWRRLLRPIEVKKISNDGSGINFHYSGSHWPSVLGRFVKTSGQARSLLYVKT